jgi:hypothetical protein
MADNNIIKNVTLSDGTKADFDVKYWGGLVPKSKQDALVSGTNIKTIDGQSILGKGNIYINKLLPIIDCEYLQLVSWINDDSLVPGQQYRITDYITTTTQENTEFAGYQFDIIVTALSKNTLSEEARAIQSQYDHYFDECNLSAWKIWYCIDNDTNRFAWADSGSGEGKGVIYRMIDEYGNDCPYDFKSIRFRRLINNDGSIATEDNYDHEYYYYTFSYEEKSDGETINISDASIVGNNEYLMKICGVYGNVIKACYNINKYESQEPTKQFLNDIVFLNNSSVNFYGCYSNVFGNDCYNNTFGTNCYLNTFGSNCFDNIFGNYCNNNTFGNSCYSNRFLYDNNTLIDYINNVYFESNVCECVLSLNGNFEINESFNLRNINVGQGFTSHNEYIDIDDYIGGVSNYIENSCEIMIRRDGSGNIRVFCLMDYI